MKKHKISRAVIAAVTITSALALSACEGAQESRGTIPEDRDEKPTEAPEPTKPSEDPTPTPDVPAQDERVDLTFNELDQINNETVNVYNGFFTCDYCCPEMIDWGNVCYNGAGIDTQLTDEELEEYLAGRELVTGITVIKKKDLEDYCRITTGTDFSTALREPAWDYSYDLEAYVSEHGDTNFMHIEVSDGYKEGDIYHLFFNVYDHNISDYRYYELTARVTKDGSVWNFISNMPANAPTQSGLLHIDYFNEDADFPSDDMIYVEELPDDEPNWYWARITADEDDTLVVIDRADVSSDNSMELIWNGIFLPGERLYSTTLNKGDNFAIRVNMAWTPVIHLGASRDGFEGEYSFGQDNWRHNEKDDGTPASHPVIGFDSDAMGFGLNPKNNIQFYNMLSGGWVYLDDNGQARGFLQIDRYGGITIHVFEDSISAFFNLENIDNDGQPVANAIRVECDEDELKRFNIPDLPTYLENTYEVEAKQLYDCQQLTLTPVEKKDDIIHLMLFGDEERQQLVFYRYNTCAE